jgi:hypothetical protein
MKGISESETAASAASRATAWQQWRNIYRRLLTLGGAAVWRGSRRIGESVGESSAQRIWRRRREDEELAANSNMAAKAEMAKISRLPGGYLVAFEEIPGGGGLRAASAGGSRKKNVKSMAWQIAWRGKWHVG